MADGFDEVAEWDANNFGGAGGHIDINHNPTGEYSS
jgi:hypothetical protein